MQGAASIDTPRRDLFDRLEGALAGRTAQFIWLFAFALITRVSVFGDTNYFSDELLYLQIGQRMHDGLLPYVDLWDRKGPGLFALYWLIAFIPGVIGYQIAAWLFAGATALTIQRIAERFAKPFAATLAATLYLAMLPMYAGGGGQAAVFYNLFVALAALLVLKGRPVPAMLLAGLAASFKQTALVEGLFLGLWALWQVRGVGAGKLAALTLKMALAGAAPMLLGAACYAAAGHFAEFWSAMVTSNLTKAYNPGGDHWSRIGALAVVGAPVLLPAFAGALMRRGFVALWAIAGLGSVALLPNFIDHYMLPALVPLSVAAAPALGYRRIGALYAVCALFFVLLVSPALNFEARRQSAAQMEQLAATVQKGQIRPRLLVYQGPVYLYRMTGQYPPSPIFFPFHLHAGPEDNTSWMDTAAEMRRILAWQPQVVVVAKDLHGRASNPRTIPLVEAYLQSCRKWAEQEATDYYGPAPYVVYGDCGNQLAGGAPSGGGPATGR